MKGMLPKFFITVFSIYGCSSPSDQKVINEKSTEWRKLKCGLFINPRGDIGFASSPEIANFHTDELMPEQCPNVFITTIGSDYKTSLNSVVDTGTFEVLGSEFFRDKSRIYNHYAMCDGGYLNIFATDTSTFKMLGRRYASYRNKIYHSRNGLLNADAESFRTFSEFEQIARDKDGFFSFDERITEEQLRKDLGDESFEKLKDQ